MHDINDLERRGLPGVFVASCEFVTAAKTQSDKLGLDTLGVFTPHPIQDRTDAEMNSIADATVDALIAALTNPDR